MNRIITLSSFFLRELGRSWYVIIPPALVLAVFRVLFSYRADPAYLAAVGGISMMIISVITLLIIADIANRGALYPFVVRLAGRWELVAALSLSALAVTIVLSALFMVAVQWAGIVALSPLLVLVIGMRWGVLFVFGIAFALHLSRLIGRRGSNLAAYALLVLVLSSYERDPYELEAVPAIVAKALDILVQPIHTLLVQADDLLAPLHYLGALALTLAYACLLFALAVVIFRRRDLTWGE